MGNDTGNVHFVNIDDDDEGSDLKFYNNRNYNNTMEFNNDTNNDDNNNNNNWNNNNNNNTNNNINATSTITNKSTTKIIFKAIYHGFLMGTVVSCILFTHAFRAHFWFTQIEKQKLGLTLREWVCAFFGY